MNELQLILPDLLLLHVLVWYMHYVLILEMWQVHVKLCIPSCIGNTVIKDTFMISLTFIYSAHVSCNHLWERTFFELCCFTDFKL